MVKINMMCGKRDWSKEGWISIDQIPLGHVGSPDVFLFNQFSNSVDIIYCSHGIGYFDLNDAIELIGWWFKKLRPVGILRIATPDFDVLSKLYQEGVEMNNLIGPLMGRMDAGKVIYHKSLWDEKRLTKVLLDAGFTNVRRYDHHYTEHPNTGNREDYYDDCSCAYIDGVLVSLNMEATKPL